MSDITRAIRRRRGYSPRPRRGNKSRDAAREANKIITDAYLEMEKESDTSRRESDKEERRRAESERKRLLRQQEWDRQQKARNAEWDRRYKVSEAARANERRRAQSEAARRAKEKMRAKEEAARLKEYNDPKAIVDYAAMKGADAVREVGKNLAARRRYAQDQSAFRAAQVKRRMRGEKAFERKMRSLGWVPDPNLPVGAVAEAHQLPDATSSHPGWRKASSGAWDYKQAHLAAERYSDDVVRTLEGLQPVPPRPEDYYDTSMENLGQAAPAQQAEAPPPEAPPAPEFPPELQGFPPELQQRFATYPPERQAQFLEFLRLRSGGQ